MGRGGGGGEGGEEEGGGGGVREGVEKCKKNIVFI